MALADRIKLRRQEKGISAAELARRAEISKGYLSEIENGVTPRPSADVLYRIASALETTMADLLERRETRPTLRGVPATLRAFADQDNLPEGDVQMLARIRFRGDQPSAPEDWRFLYESIKRSIRPRTE
jgi:transcriptional regulator with XRE-family HTH domain